jgi:hypothetical protein
MMASAGATGASGGRSCSKAFVGWPAHRRRAAWLPRLLLLRPASDDRRYLSFRPSFDTIAPSVAGAPLSVLAALSGLAGGFDDTRRRAAPRPSPRRGVAGRTEIGTSRRTMGHQDREKNPARRTDGLSPEEAMTVKAILQKGPRRLTIGPDRRSPTRQIAGRAQIGALVITNGTRSCRHPFRARHRAGHCQGAGALRRCATP